MSSSFQVSGGWMEVVAGSMFSGKTEELLRRVRRATIARKRVQVFKSHLDDRYAGLWSVSSHDRRTFEAIPVDSSAQILLRLDPMAQVVAIDEAQFLDAGIVQVASSLADRGRRVILAGIDSDFRGEPFGPMPQLMAVAELVDKLHAICVLCGAPASRNQRLIGGKPAPYDSPTIMVGAADAYEARCRACHMVPRATEAQQQLL
ncbi:MAG: thymidine kinase [Gemmatimonadota bacterium]|jgi:thymidine kinase|nr:thymidine kinase [Gemmatimonadota bacterium]